MWAVHEIALTVGGEYLCFLECSNCAEVDTLVLYPLLIKDAADFSRKTTPRKMNRWMSGLLRIGHNNGLTNFIQGSEVLASSGE